MVFLTLVLFVIPDAYSQTSSVSKDMVIVLDNSGTMRIDDPELPVSKVVSSILGSLPEDSRVSFVVFAGKLKMLTQFTAVTDAIVGKKTQEALSILGDIRSNATITVNIRKGDTLWELADKYYGDPHKWPLIFERNRLSGSGKDLTVGTVIQIPSKDARSSAGGTGKKERATIPMAIEKAIYELKQSGRADAEKQIVLITDGLIDVRDSALAVERYRWLKDELASDSKAAGIRVFSIALTEQADFEFMQTLAHKTSGGYYRVFRTEDIQTALSGMNEPVPIAKPVSPQPQPQVVQARTTPAKVKKRSLKGFLSGLTTRELMVTAAVVAGLIALSVIIFAFVKRGKKAPERSSISVAGAYLMDLSGITEKSNYAFNKDIIKIGRAGNEDVDICINKGTVSSIHAQIEHKDDGFYLTDLGSTNGTYLNDEMEGITDEVRLKAGDIVSFDQYKFKLVVRGQGDRGAIPSSENKQAKELDKSSSSTPGIPREPAVASVEATGEAIKDEDVAKLEAYLEDTSGVTDKESHKISKRVVKIGRVKGNAVDIYIDGETISGIHAQIEYKDHDFYLNDMGSTNGTYLNEERERITSEVCLKGNDVIYFDQYKFKFVMHEQKEHSEAQLSASPSGAIGG
jgi:pSer/pThr/pTyr-binding forkhead associated (FHA) protein/LysM repeat protein